MRSEFHAGKIAEEWEVLDPLTLVQQLGPGEDGQIQARNRYDRGV